MNKRKIEGIIWFAVGLVLVLLLLNKSKMLSDNVYAVWNNSVFL